MQLLLFKASFLQHVLEVIWHQLDVVGLSDWVKACVVLLCELLGL
jgi:hypothetical protein